MKTIRIIIGTHFFIRMPELQYPLPFCTKATNSFPIFKTSLISIYLSKLESYSPTRYSAWCLGHYLLFSYDCLFTYDCYLLKVVYLLTIVGYSCSSRGSDCNRDASSVSCLYFYCIFIVFLLYYILSDEFIKLKLN